MVQDEDVGGVVFDGLVVSVPVNDEALLEPNAVRAQLVLVPVVHVRRAKVGLGVDPEHGTATHEDGDREAGVRCALILIWLVGLLLAPRG